MCEHCDREEVEGVRGEEGEEGEEEGKGGMRLVRNGWGSTRLVWREQPRQPENWTNLVSG